MVSPVWTTITVCTSLVDRLRHESGLDTTDRCQSVRRSSSRSWGGRIKGPAWTYLQPHPRFGPPQCSLEALLRCERREHYLPALRRLQLAASGFGPARAGFAYQHGRILAEVGVVH